MIEAVKQLFWSACYYLFLICFAAGIYAVNLACFVMTFLIRPEKARRLLRGIVHQLFRLYIGLMLQSGALRSNCAILKRPPPGTGGRLIIANHPSIVDAPLFLSRIPGLVCVFKSSLKRSFTISRTARTLGYLSNDEGIALLKEMAIRLKAGEQVLVFPEGTRTSGDLLEPLNPGYALAAMRAQVPVQLVRIRADSPILSKRQAFYKTVRFPAGFQFDFGPCIEPGSFHTVKAFNAFVEDWYRKNLNQPVPLKRPFLPVECAASHAQDESIQITFRVPDDPYYCHGHMPGNPLVPAYAQMGWVHEILLTHGTAPAGYFLWKFLKPILPGNSVEISIGPPSQRRDVQINSDGQRMTQGKLLSPYAAQEGAP